MTAIQPPILTIGKNLSGIDVLKDKTNLITKLYPRGTGSPPSELTLDSPTYWPAAQSLVLDHTDSAGSAYFTLPDQYSTYAGFTKSGDPLPSGYYVGMDTSDPYDLAYEPYPTGGPGTSISGPNTAAAIIFYETGPWRIYSVSLCLQRVITPPGTQWTTQPRFIVGIYSVYPSASQSGATSGFQAPGYFVPYQGPLTWCYGNLLSISTTEPTWYEFPMQTSPYPWSKGWAAIVVMPYPTSNKQWGGNGMDSNDSLWLGGAPSLGGATPSSSVQCYLEWTYAGVTPKAWSMVAAPYKNQAAFRIKVINQDVTSNFLQADLGQPGRWLFSNVRTMLE